MGFSGTARAHMGYRNTAVQSQPPSPPTVKQTRGGSPLLHFYPHSSDHLDRRFALLEHGLRATDIRVTLISPGVTTSDLADTISDPSARAAMRDFRRVAIPADAIARAIAFAVEQPDDVDVSEIIVRPTASPY